jgi:hypothetical protein
VIAARRIRSWALPALAATLFLTIGIGSAILLTSKKRTLDSLVITTVPSGATVTLDGKLLGPSPVRLENVPLGPHSIQATKDGFLPLEERTDIQEDLDEPLTLELRAEPPRGTAGGTADEHVAEYIRLAEAAFDTEHFVSPYHESALYYADAVRSVAKTSSYPDEMRARIRGTMIDRARQAERRDPTSSVAILDQLARAFPNDPDVDAAIREENEQTGSIAATVDHVHESGACTGTLAASRLTLRFASTVPEHSFTASGSSVLLSTSGRTLELRIGRRMPRFRFPSREALTRFVRSYERMRRN